MTCPLCGRPLGARFEAHHLVPKTYGGRETVLLHPICHRKIHAVFTERDLRNRFNTIEALKGHEEIRRFINWIAKKDPDFHIATYISNERRSRRRR